MDSNVGALKNEVAQLRRLVADLRGELGKVLTHQNDMERSFEERLNRHMEDLDWDREESILLRTGLQENEDRIAELSIRGQQMARQLCRCADHQGPPISAVGSPQPPPYARTPSPEFQTPPQEFMPVVDLPSSPPSAVALPVPPPVSQSPIPFPEQENTPLTCCFNPPMTEAPLVPIEVESDDAEGLGEVEESSMGRVGEEAISQLWRNNQSRAAGRRVVRASNLVHPHPYAHAKGLGDFWARRARFLQQVGGDESSDESASSREDSVLPH